MPAVCFDAANGEGILRDVSPCGSQERSHLDGITESRASAVSLPASRVAVITAETRGGQGGCQHHDLGLAVGRGQACTPPVLPHRAALEPKNNVGIATSRRHNDGRTRLAPSIAVSAGVERMAAAQGGEHTGDSKRITRAGG
eukprot:scaffold156177_cov31-Tisochrysis_lutea.AAC.2